MGAAMQLRIDPGGQVTCVYGEALELAALGIPTIRRASYVEPDAAGWWADLTPVSGPRLGPYRLRSEALAAEAAWLKAYLFAESIQTNPVSASTSLSWSRATL